MATTNSSLEAACDVSVDSGSSSGGPDDVSCSCYIATGGYETERLAQLTASQLAILDSGKLLAAQGHLCAICFRVWGSWELRAQSVDSTTACYATLHTYIHVHACMRI